MRVPSEIAFTNSLLRIWIASSTEFDKFRFIQPYRFTTSTLPGCSDLKQATQAWPVIQCFSW